MLLIRGVSDELLQHGLEIARISGAKSDYYGTGLILRSLCKLTEEEFLRCNVWPRDDQASGNGIRCTSLALEWLASGRGQYILRSIITGQKRRHLIQCLFIRISEDGLYYQHQVHNPLLLITPK